MTVVGFSHLFEYGAYVPSETAKICFFKTKSGTTEISMQTVRCFNIIAGLPWIPDLTCHKNLFSLHSMYIQPKLAVSTGSCFTSSEFLLFASLCYGKR